jgi:hypothetical protein
MTFAEFYRHPIASTAVVVRALLKRLRRNGKPLEIPQPVDEPPPIAPRQTQHEPAPLPPPPTLDDEPAPLPPPRPVKWIKPKGTEQLVKRERHETEAKPTPARTPRPKTRPDDDPEQWGQFYFRDAILDQLDRYFVYLKRMKRGDRDAYNLHRQLGIHVMPQNTIKTFDAWRSAGEADQLSKWWNDHRPGFGAIAYGIDQYAEIEQSLSIADLPPDHPTWKSHRGQRPDLPPAGRIVSSTKGDERIDGDRLGIIWVPKFLYFMKYSLPPNTVQAVSNADVYALTVYWDRVDGKLKKFEKRRGGVAQEYAVCVDKATGAVRVLRLRLIDAIKIRHKYGAMRGHTSTINQVRWAVPTDHLLWSRGRDDASPEDYLRRLFIEAALMYETAGMGSMIRIEAHRDNLVAAFAIDIKRTAYFFKDRDVTVTAAGTRKPIFHIVRPHVRKSGATVRLHFRGLKQFDWAGYNVKISVPGRDHLHLPEIDIGAIDGDRRAPHQKTMGTKKLGLTLRGWINDRLGAMQ